MQSWIINLLRPCFTIDPVNLNNLGFKFYLFFPSANDLHWQLFFYKPNLWWPNGMGKQSLYNVIITIDVKGHGESDSWNHHFGFRKIESHIDGATGGRYYGF